MSDIGPIGGPQQTHQTQGAQQATGTFAGFKVAVGEALGRVADAFKSFGTSIANFFTSLFSMSVRQEQAQPRVAQRTDLTASTEANTRLAREVQDGLDVPSVTEQFDVPNRTDVTVSRIFARDLQGSGKNITFGGEEIFPQKDIDGNKVDYTREERVEMITGLLVQRFGTDGANLVSKYANQGTFASVDVVLNSTDTPVETPDGRKVFPLSGERPFFIDISQDHDGAIRMTFTQEYRNIQMLQPVDPNDTDPPPLVNDGAVVETRFDIVLRRDQDGVYQPHYGPLQVSSNLGMS